MGCTVCHTYIILVCFNESNEVESAPSLWEKGIKRRKNAFVFNLNNRDEISNITFHLFFCAIARVKCFILMFTFVIIGVKI